MSEFNYNLGVFLSMYVEVPVPDDMDSENYREIISQESLCPVLITPMPEVEKVLRGHYPGRRDNVLWKSKRAKVKKGAARPAPANWQRRQQDDTDWDTTGQFDINSGSSINPVQFPGISAPNSAQILDPFGGASAGESIPIAPAGIVDERNTNGENIFHPKFHMDPFGSDFSDLPIGDNMNSMQNNTFGVQPQVPNGSNPGKLWRQRQQNPRKMRVVPPNVGPHQIPQMNAPQIISPSNDSFIGNEKFPSPNNIQIPQNPIGVMNPAFQMPMYPPINVGLFSDMGSGLPGLPFDLRVPGPNMIDNMNLRMPINPLENQNPQMQIMDNNINIQHEWGAIAGMSVAEMQKTIEKNNVNDKIRDNFELKNENITLKEQRQNQIQPKQQIQVHLPTQISEMNAESMFKNPNSSMGDVVARQKVQGSSPKMIFSPSNKKNDMVYVQDKKINQKHDIFQDFPPSEWPKAQMMDTIMNPKVTRQPSQPAQRKIQNNDINLQVVHNPDNKASSKENTPNGNNNKQVPQPSKQVPAKSKPAPNNGANQKTTAQKQDRTNQVKDKAKNPPQQSNSKALPTNQDSKQSETNKNNKKQGSAQLQQQQQQKGKSKKVDSSQQKNLEDTPLFPVFIMKPIQSLPTSSNDGSGEEWCCVKGKQRKPKPKPLETPKQKKQKEKQQHQPPAPPKPNFPFIPGAELAE